MITSQHLPPPHQLRKLMQSLAALDAVYSPEWQYRYYSFDTNWAADEEMGSIRNGSGDDVFALFTSEGCFLKGCSHEYLDDKITPDAFYTGVPEVFQAGLKEPAFSPNRVSFCNWTGVKDSEWKAAIDTATLDPKIFFLLEGLDGDPKTYNAFTSDYYEINTDLEHISAIYRHKPMTIARAKSMNAEIVYEELIESLKQIGYPIEVESSLNDSEVTGKPRGLFSRLFGKD